MFVLSEQIEVRGAWMDHGLLHIDLERPQPEGRVRTIRIDRGQKPTNGTHVVDGDPDQGA